MQITRITFRNNTLNAACSCFVTYTKLSLTKAVTSAKGTRDYPSIFSQSPSHCFKVNIVTKNQLEKNTTPFLSSEAFVTKSNRTDTILRTQQHSVFAVLTHSPRLSLIVLLDLSHNF